MVVALLLVHIRLSSIWWESSGALAENTALIRVCVCVCVCV